MASRSTARARALVLLMLAGTLTGFGDAATPPSAPRGQSAAKPDDGFIRYFGQALHGGYSGRLYYNGDECGQLGYPLPVPQPAVRAPREDETGPAAVHGVFRDDPGMAVAELPGGLISARIGAVPDAILRTRIARLRFDERERYNPTLAIRAIENVTEVQHAMDALETRESSWLIKTLIQPSDEKFPHLPATMTNMTMDEALDEVARTFKVIIIYSACEPAHLFHIDYAAIDAPWGASMWR